jgi:DnaK suppressor protein
MSKPSFDRTFLERQRARLAALREQLLGTEQQTSAEARALREDHQGAAEEAEEGAQDSAQDEVYRSLHNVDDRRLRNIERALRKIDEGTYGFSDVSGKEIPKARLDAAPEAILTVEEERQAEEK